MPNTIDSWHKNTQKHEHTQRMVTLNIIIQGWAKVTQTYINMPGVFKHIILALSNIENEPINMLKI